ncbi:MAG: translation initiation factor IF-3 [Candidatus Levybacteria bacterium RIFCSPLOWO2_01_FULL_38_21]|nr:MAG: translation initiation factor IF-3 [Candidatus Levybacteria bacterium RIFCSPLOWO2_01_FULL_38_21]
MKRSKKRQGNRKFYRINERIFSSTLRVLESGGKQLGILSRQIALNKARELSLDLVEIAPKANPPVAKIIDYKKFLYQEEKKRKEEKRKSKGSETKELRLGPFMNDHDLMVVLRKAREFLEAGNKVKFVVKFAGRQITHPEFGEKILERSIGSLSDVSKIEQGKHFEGRQLITILSPERRKENAKEKNKKIDKKEI